jgi:hypothetical protein
MINVRYSLREYRGPILMISNETLKILANHILTIYFLQKMMLQVSGWGRLDIPTGWAT